MKYRVTMPDSNQLYEIEASNHQEAITTYLQHLLGFSAGSIITAIGIQGELESRPTFYVNHIKLEIFSQLSKNRG